ncbi:MAG: elongation factor P-like protein YeiP [Gammaproteobacteria bacterium]|nr:elongation factor P-like protein YeiP [Gammaproteobacteria bacterium]
MPKAAEIKKGMILEIDNQLLQVRNIDVRSPSSRGSNTLYKITMMNIQKHQKQEQTLIGTDFIKEAECSRCQLQFLYRDTDLYTFMDTESYMQYSLTTEELDDLIFYLPDGQSGIVGLLHHEQLISIEPPASISLTIIETSPAIKGASASARTKPATLETQLVVQVPEYIENGEVIKVNTATGKYTSRA